MKVSIRLLTNHPSCLPPSHVALEDGLPRPKSSALSSELSKIWNAMTPEEQVEATDAGVLALQSQRKEQANYTVRTVPIQAFHDAKKTLETIEREV